jgi:hypothetical protein
LLKGEKNVPGYTKTTFIYTKSLVILIWELWTMTAILKI